MAFDIQFKLIYQGIRDVFRVRSLSQYFTTLWDAANLKTNQIQLDDADKGNWAGVRIERSGDTYNVYYFNGKSADVTTDAPKSTYTNTQAMQNLFGNGQAPKTWTP